MKKKLIIILLICFMVIPKVYASADTLGDLKNELTKLKNQKSTNESKKKKTKDEMLNTNAKITSAHEAVEQAETDIEIAKREIEKTNREIENMKKEAQELMVFYQVMQGDNSVMEYISGSSNLSDMIIRKDAVNYIISYTTSTLKDFEQNITDNAQLQIDLKKKEIELEDKISKYEQSLDSLENDYTALMDISLDINEQIKAQEELIKYYEEIGCKDNELLSDCVNVSSSSRWFRPLARGVITSAYGYRTITLNGKKKSSFHAGVDIGGNSGGTPIYSTAAGTVAGVIKKSSCGGNIVIIHERVQGKAYTSYYAHLTDIYVKVGDKVTQQTVIGTVGGGGKTIISNGGWDTCSTGYHLHYAVGTGFYLGGGSEGYSSYSTFVSKTFNPPEMPAYGKWFYTRY